MTTGARLFLSACIFAAIYIIFQIAEAVVGGL